MRKSVPNPSILDECERIGAPQGRKRWRSADGALIYEWDDVHGEVEFYNRRGRHLGVLDPTTGDLIKDPVRGRKVKV